MKKEGIKSEVDGVPPKKFWGPFATYNKSKESV